MRETWTERVRERERDRENAWKRSFDSTTFSLENNFYSTSFSIRFGRWFGNLIDGYQKQKISNQITQSKRKENKMKKKKSKSIRYEMSLTFGIAVILRGTTAFRSISLRSELRSPWRLRNSEFRSRVNGFESVKSNIEGASALPTWNQIEKFFIQSQIELRSAGKWTQFKSN